MTKRDLVVASTRHHLARLLKYYPRRPCAPSLIKSRFFPHTTNLLTVLTFLLLKFLICIHAGNPRVPPRVLASGPKPCGGKRPKPCGGNKAHSVIIRRILIFRRRLWQVSKMKISPQYPVLTLTLNYGNFVDHVRCTYNNLLPKITNYGAFIPKTKAKKSHITNNSQKVTHGQ